MQKFNTQSVETYVPEGMTGLLGFQEVKSNKDKVFVWIKQRVERPAAQDRHATTRMANNSQRKMEYGKSPWLKEEVWRHFSSYFIEQEFTREEFFGFNNNPDCDVWETRSDGDRKFFLLSVFNPKSDVTGKHLNIQITQSIGKAPSSIYTRAYEEALVGEGDYNLLLNKYKKSAMVQTYSPSIKAGSRIVHKELTPVYVSDVLGKLPVYEESEVVLGEPLHRFVDYETHDAIPIDILNIEDTIYTNEIRITTKESTPEDAPLRLQFEE